MPDGKHVAEHKCALQMDLVGTPHPKNGTCLDARLQDALIYAKLHCSPDSLQSVTPLGVSKASPP